MNLRFWLRWSWRDLRARWLQVAAIGLIIALGTGVFAGLGGQKSWRINSYDLSYERLNFYDLHVELAEGSYIDAQEVVTALEGLDGVDAVEARLITDTLVDASTEDETILVKGRITGVDVSDGGPKVNSLYVGDGDGRMLSATDSGQNIALVEYKFAKHYDLEPGHPIRISGDVSLDFVGAMMTPEYFLVVPETGSFFAEGSFAAIIVPLETAQLLVGREGLVNDIVLTIEDGADAAAVQAEVENRLGEVFPDVGMTASSRDNDFVYTTLYSDAESDQQTWNIIAVLFLIGAAMGAFNLAGRIVESQRRQIGISMALGVPRFWIAFRPMLVGVQIAVLGTLFGLIIGYALSKGYEDLLRSFTPMPYWDIKFYLPGYIQATAVGILMPFIATMIPVWRAIRVAPVDAIQSGYLVAKGGGLGKLANNLSLPGRSFVHMPVKNLLRSPWRTLLTVLGVAIAVMLMTTMVGAADTFIGTIDQADEAYTHVAGDRLLVNMDFFYSIESDTVSDLLRLTNDNGSPLFAETEAALIAGGTVSTEADSFEIGLELHDMANAIWTPALIEGQLDNGGMGIIISEKAARDLNVSVGDTITLEHPRREGMLAFQLVETEVPVIGIHDNPLRPLSYMDMRAAELMGFGDVTNFLVVTPAEGVTADDIKMALLTHPGVASVEAITDFSEGFEDVLSLVTTFLRVTQVIAIGLAFLIAFNSTSISVDERVREIATMFAFGLRIRTVTRMQMLENILIGLMGTIIGVALGWIVLSEVLFGQVEEEMADIHFLITISPATIGLSAVIGVLVVGLTPLLSIRKMRKMDIPSMLRVME